MFDDALMESFFYYKRYGEVILTKIKSEYKGLTHEEEVQKCKCILAILQEFNPSLSIYYMNSFLNELCMTYTKLNKDDSLTSIEYLPLNDRMIINKGALNELTFDDCCNENNLQVTKILKDAYFTLLGYDNYDKDSNSIPLVIL